MSAFLKLNGYQNVKAVFSDEDALRELATGKYSVLIIGAASQPQPYHAPEISLHPKLSTRIIEHYGNRLAARDISQAASGPEASMRTNQNQLLPGFENRDYQISLCNRIIFPVAVITPVTAAFQVGSSNGHLHCVWPPGHLQQSL